MRSILIGGIIAAAAGFAGADTVHLQFMGMGQNEQVRVSIGASTFNTRAGQMNHKFSAGNGVAAPLSGQTLITFCTDLTESATSGGSTYLVAPIASLPQTSGWPAMGASRAQAVYNLYSAAAGQQYGGNSEYSAAFQVALWEIVYDFGGTLASLNLTSGNFEAKDTDNSALDSTIAGYVTGLFSAVTSGPNAAQTGLMGLTNNGCQDQIVQTVVPLPGAWALAVLGLGVAWRRASRRA